MLDGAPEGSRWAGLLLRAPRLALLAGFGPSPRVQTEMKGPAAIPSACQVRPPRRRSPRCSDSSGASGEPALDPCTSKRGGGLKTRAEKVARECRSLSGGGCGVCAPTANNKATQTSGHAHNLPDLTAVQHKCPRCSRYVLGWTMKDRCSPPPQTSAGVRREAMRSRFSGWGQRGGGAASSRCFAASAELLKPTFVF